MTPSPLVVLLSYLHQTLTFTSRGGPFLELLQRTRELKGDGSLGTPLHTESGYITWRGTPTPEMVVCDPSGQAQTLRGELRVGDGVLPSLTFTSTHCVATPGGKAVSEIVRRYELTDGGAGLLCSLDMAAVGQPLQRHLTCVLHREAPIAVATADAATAISARAGTLVVFDVRSDAEVCLRFCACVCVSLLVARGAGRVGARVARLLRTLRCRSPSTSSPQSWRRSQHRTCSRV
jgi:hypothetical protein